MATTPGDDRPTRLRLLLDSNVVVAAEPYAGVIEPNLGPAAELLRTANELGHVLCVAPATHDDVLQNLDRQRRRQRLAELQKFSQLEEVPLTKAFQARAGESEPGSNDHRDLRLLATLDAGAVNFLVTEDQRLQRRARRAGLGERVISLSEAVELMRGFTSPQSPTPPRVERLPSYALDPEQGIFDTLRADYGGFDQWLDRVRRDSDRRVCLVIRDDREYAAIALLKLEEDCAYGFPAPVTKISTFKVGSSFGRVKYGELLLKAVFGDAAERRVRTLYVEVFTKHEQLISMLKDFGFADSGHRTERGELVMLKIGRPGPGEGSQLSDLDFHIRYGPPALRMTQAVFVVPIQPIWHDQLFPERARPDAELQLPLFEIAARPLTHPWGNALRKAYLCNSPTTTMRAGDVLLFYKSGGAKAIEAVGIVEDTSRSEVADEVARFVGQRTVYTFDEISDMCRSVRGLLAIRFRQDRFIDPELSLAELQTEEILKSWPQSITRVPERRLAWLRDRLSV